MLRPTSIDALAAAVRVELAVRAVDAGHSFMPLVSTGGLILSPEYLPGEVVPSPDRQTARAPADHSIGQLTAELFVKGYALAHQGDVNPQSFAGSMAAGTHGTGRAIGSLATMARGFHLIDAGGIQRWCDAQANRELF